MNWDKYPNFHREEFDSPDAPGSGDLMDENFVWRLQKVRNKLDRPMVITSGYRTERWNRRVGGKANSAHLRGFAVDIACESSTLRHELLKLLLKEGFNRLGIANGFIHVDCDRSLPSNVIWTY